LARSHKLVGRLVLAGLISLGCVSKNPAPAPAAPAPAVVAVPGAPPADWNAPPTNGSPGMNVPKLSGNNLIANATFGGGKSLPWTNSFSSPGAGRSFVAKDGEL